jgi:hypothetical protein
MEQQDCIDEIISNIEQQLGITLKQYAIDHIKQQFKEALVFVGGPAKPFYISCGSIEQYYCHLISNGHSDNYKNLTPEQKVIYSFIEINDFKDIIYEISREKGDTVPDIIEFYNDGDKYYVELEWLAI